LIREKIDASRERQIILYSIVSTEFLKEIYPIAKPELFKTPYAQTVWRWCSKYFSEFNSAPNKDIQDIYISHKMEIQDDDEEEAIATFLQSLSRMEEQTNNIPFLIKQAEEWLNLRSLELLKDSLADAIQRKDIVSGQQAIAEYAKIDRVKIDSLSVLSDVDDSISAFIDENKTLFSFPGAVGAVIGHIQRTDFMAFAGFMKSGKSLWLWEVAKMAMFNSKQVLFISLEMPKSQMLRRIWSNLFKRPKKYPTKARIPYFVEEDTINEDEVKWSVAYEEKDVEPIIPSRERFDSWIAQYKKYFGGGDVRITSMPSRSVTVRDIESYISNLEYYEGWIPDVVVIDYADLIRSDLKGDTRHKLDDIWANLRRVALEREIAVISATQTDRSTSKKDIEADNISEDIRKLAHATKVIAINSTKQDKAKGIYRVEQLVDRDDSPCFEQAIVLSCLDIGQVCLDSRFKSEVVLGGRDGD
jgi:replicative DNA helicase